MWLRNWPIDLRRRREPGDRRAVVIVRTEVQRQIVQSCCNVSTRAGVQPGMTIAEARALLSSRPFRLIEHDPQYDSDHLRKLARWSTRWLPRVTSDPAGNDLLADISGCERLYRGEDRLLRRLGAMLNRAGLAARLASGPTFGSAWAAAHFGSTDSCIIADGQQRTMLSSLPVDALRIDAETVAGLNEVGVETIGQLLQLPRAMLPARFADDLLLQLDRAMGYATELIDAISDEPDLAVEQPFAGPVMQWESIECAAQLLLERLCRLLLGRESGLRKLRVTLERYRQTPTWFDVGASRPTREQRHLWQLLRPRLERADLGEGVERMVFTAVNIDRITHRQIAMDGTSAALHRSEGELIDLLAARLGRERVCRVTAREAHQPDRVYQLVEADRMCRPASVMLTDHLRPSRLISEQPVEVTMVWPDGPVGQLVCRRRVRRVITCIGPERIGGMWWQSDGDDRDYFRVQLEDGRWWWLCRVIEHETGKSRWSIRGCWA